MIGLIQKYVGKFPLTIAEILREVRIKGHFNYRQWWKILSAGLLILGAGASVGPEASASGLVAGMVYWLGCRYKFIRDLESSLRHQSYWKQICIICTKRLSTIGQQKSFNQYFDNVYQRKLFYWRYTIIGLIGFFGYFHFFPQEGVIGFHHPNIIWHWQGIFGVLPALAIGWLFGFIFVKIGKLSDRWIGQFNQDIIKALIGGLLLIIASQYNKDVLFSDEFNIIPFVHSSLKLAPLYLVGLALLKTLVTNVGFALGWRGGTIFPAIFSSLAIGAALAQLIRWMPQLTASLVVATAITVILERPLISTIVLILLLPVQFSIFIIIICYFTNWLVNKFKILKP